MMTQGSQSLDAINNRAEIVVGKNVYLELNN